MSSPNIPETFYSLPVLVYDSVWNRDGRLSSETGGKWNSTVQAGTEKKARQVPRALILKVSEGKDPFLSFPICHRAIIL